MCVLLTATHDNTFDAAALLDFSQQSTLGTTLNPGDDSISPAPYKLVNSGIPPKERVGIRYVGTSRPLREISHGLQFIFEIADSSNGKWKRRSNRFSIPIALGEKYRLPVFGGVYELTRQPNNTLTYEMIEPIAPALQRQRTIRLIHPRS